MTKVCTHGRDASLAMQMLEQSLRRLQTDHLDLWQIHGVTFQNDPGNLSGRTARPRRCTRPSSKAKFALWVLVDIRILISIWLCWIRASLSMLCKCR